MIDTIDAHDAWWPPTFRPDGLGAPGSRGGRSSVDSHGVEHPPLVEELGVITGYTVTVDHAKLGRPLEAFSELRFAGNTKVDEISTIAKDIPEVRAVFTIAGDPDALVWLRVKDVEDLKHVIDRLRRTGKVVGTKTLMVLGTWTQLDTP
jgi:hypothetical protein